MAGACWLRLLAARYSAIRSREGAGVTAVDEECDSIVVMVVTDEGEESAEDDDEGELERGG